MVHGNGLQKVVLEPPCPDAAAPKPHDPSSDHPNPGNHTGDRPPYSGGAIETVGLESAHASHVEHPAPADHPEHPEWGRRSRNLEMERSVDGPRPDLSEYDKYEAYLQAQSLTSLVQDAFALQKEHLLNRISWTLFVASPGLVNLYRSWPLLRQVWANIPFCENAFGPYADFVLALLLVVLSSALCSILFVRILEMRDARYVLLIAILLGASFLMQEAMIVGWAQLGRMLGIE